MLVNRKKHSSHHYGQQKLGSLCHLNENRQNQWRLQRNSEGSSNK